MSGLSIARVILYVRDIPAVAAFYGRFFGMEPLPGGTDGWLELACPSGDCTIALHQAAKSQKSGAAMKLVFAVSDVQAFVRACKKRDWFLALSIAQMDLLLRMRRILPAIPSAFPAGVFDRPITLEHAAVLASLESSCNR